MHTGAAGHPFATEFIDRFDGAIFGDDKLVQYKFLVGRIGAENLQQTGLRNLGNAKCCRAGAIRTTLGPSGNHGFGHLLRAGKFEGLDIQAGFLEIAFFDCCKKWNARGYRPKPDPNLGAGLTHDQCRGTQSSQCDAAGF